VSLFAFPMQAAGKMARNGGGLMQTTTPVASSNSTRRGGLMGWLDANRGEGNFVERLNTFGAQLQDIGDGGNRAEEIAQQRAAQAQAQAAAEQRIQIAKMASALNLSPQDQLVFNANPESFFRMLGEREDDARDSARPTYLNTQRGVYRTGQNPGFEVEFPEEGPKVDFGWRMGEGGGLEYIPGGPADPAYRGRVAAAGRAPPRARAAPRAAASAQAPAPPWQRNW